MSLSRLPAEICILFHNFAFRKGVDDKSVFFADFGVRGGAAKCKCCSVGASVLRRRRLGVEASASQC